MKKVGKDGMYRSPATFLVLVSGFWKNVCAWERSRQSGRAC